MNNLSTQKKPREVGLATKKKKNQNTMSLFLFSFVWVNTTDINDSWPQVDWFIPLPKNLSSNHIPSFGVGISHMLWLQSCRSTKDWLNRRVPFLDVPSYQILVV